MIEPDTSATVGVVIVNWNGWRDTVAAYESLCASSYAAWRLIVIDNASSDASLAELGRLGSAITLIANPTNAGFAGGVNIGVRAAIEQGCGYVFLLNNDAAVRPDTLGCLVAASARSQQRAVLGAVLRFKETGELQYFGSRTNPHDGGPRWLDSKTELEHLQSEMIDVDFIHGAALFTPTELFNSVGLLDERFFLTYEETDWCYRARAAGFACRVVPAAVVDHVAGATLGEATSPLQAYFLQRNDFLFKEKHARPLQRARSFVDSLRRVSRSLRRAGQAGGRGIDPASEALIIGLGDYFRRRFGDCPPRVRALAAKARNQASSR